MVSELECYLWLCEAHVVKMKQGLRKWLSSRFSAEAGKQRTKRKREVIDNVFQMPQIVFL
jgi:hypothetical protein